MKATAFCVYLFETTNDAMWAEDTALGREIPAEVIPAPPEAKSKCGLALRTREAHRTPLETALDEEGVPYRRYDPN